jgi:2',3'-cyclic-nucleotide 2'-phosphodiesterase/3'-nucleotidase
VVVQAGDTLFRIAVNHGTTVSELVRLNRLANPNRILIGQVICLPG